MDNNTVIAFLKQAEFNILTHLHVCLVPKLEELGIDISSLGYQIFGWERDIDNMIKDLSGVAAERLLHIEKRRQERLNAKRNPPLTQENNGKEK